MAGINSVINEFARRPPQFKIAVFVGLGVVLGLLYWQFLLSPINTKRDEGRQAISSLESERDRLAKQEKEYRELLDMRETLERDVKSIERVLPSDAELPAFFEMLDRRFSEAGVEAKKVARQAEVTIDTFKKVPVEIEITGSYLQIKRFFASLVAGRPVGDNAEGDAEAAIEQDRIITVEDFSLKRASGALDRGGGDMLTAKFIAATFRQESAPAPAGAAKPATKPAAPASGNAPINKAKTGPQTASDAAAKRAGGADQGDQ